MEACRSHLGVNSKCHVATGKLGDVVNILPLLHDEFSKTGEKQNLIVGNEYAAEFESLSYLNIIRWSGGWQDLKEAIRWAKQNFTDVVNLSTYGKDFPFQHKTPSFLMEPWERVRRLADFDRLPLVIDGRDKAREKKLLERHLPDRPFILYADHGESSPFPHKEELAKLLKDVLGKTHVIIRLSEIRAERFFDLLALYEKASLIVATETAHLHLTRAVNVPVMAFTKDEPSRWHGSPHCKRFILTVRYGDFERRRHEIIHSLQNTTGAPRGAATLTTKQKFGYNPTILQDFEGMIYRYHPNKDWKTALVYEVGDKSFTIDFPVQYNGMSMEDARLFWYQGKPHISFVAARHEFRQTNAVVGYGELIISSDGARVDKVYIPEFGMNNWGAIEKNWVFFEHDGQLMCVYSCDIEQVVIEVRKDRIWNVMRSEPHQWPWGKIRGGCLIPWKGRLLRFFHSHTTEGHRDKWIYNIGAVLMEDKPPFKMLQISKQPIIAGDEQMNLYCRHWKQNVCFPSGVRLIDDRIYLAYGHNDSACLLASLRESDLNL